METQNYSQHVETQSRRALIPLIFILVLLSCGRSNSPSASPGAGSEAAAASPASSGAAAAAGTPVSTTATAPVAPPVPARPVPSFSAAQKVGMLAYPKSSQTRDQQLIDELDCYNQVQQQTGINPETPPPAGPSNADIQNAQQQAADQAGQAKGGRVRGAARGAVGGAVIGGIAGDAGAGAAAGATFGTVRGGRQQRKANANAKQQAADSASAQLQQQADDAKAAYNQQQSTFRRGLSACLDAKGYSAK